MKKIIFLAFISIFLSACGGGSGTSKSSQGFAPIDNAKFNDKFNEMSTRVTSSLNPNTRIVIAILLENKFKFLTETYEGTYTYTNTGKNTATLVSTTTKGKKCNIKVTFKESRKGSYIAKCDNTNFDGTFHFRE